jgi:hypothetical protein
MNDKAKEETSKLDNLLNETSEKLKLGKFDDIIKIFGQQYKEDDPDFIVIKKTIADAKMVKGDLAGANDLYVKVYDTLRATDKLGPEHPDVLSVMLDCAKTTRSIVTAINFFDQVDEIANRKNEAEIIDKSIKGRKEAIDKLSVVNRRIYNRMISKGKVITEKPPKQTQTPLTESQLDDLMKEFCLE